MYPSVTSRISFLIHHSEPGFPFCFPGEDSIPSVAAAAIFFALIPRPKGRAFQVGLSPRPRSHHFALFRRDFTDTYSLPQTSRLVSPGCCDTLPGGILVKFGKLHFWVLAVQGRNSGVQNNTYGDLQGLSADAAKLQSPHAKL